LFLVCFCVLASGTKAKTTPSREYSRLGTVIVIENIPPAVAAPTFSPPGGTYCSQTVTISTATAGATTRYTLDGSTPTETNGTVGTSVSIGSSKTLKAIAYKSGMTRIRHGTARGNSAGDGEEVSGITRGGEIPWGRGKK
jgi:hypothetical protein